MLSYTATRFCKVSSIFLTPFSVSRTRHAFIIRLMSQKRSVLDSDTHMKTDKEPSHNFDSIITDSKMPPYGLTSSRNGFSPTDLLGGRNRSYFNSALREALAITGRPPLIDGTETKLALIRAQEIVAQKEKELQIAIMCRRRQEEENARNELIYHEAVSAARDHRFLAAVSSPKRDSSFVLDATLRKRSLEESVGGIEDRMERERAMKRAMFLERMRDEDISSTNRPLQGNASMLNNFLCGEHMRTSSLTQIDRLSRGIRNDDRLQFIGNSTSIFPSNPRSPNCQSNEEMSKKMGIMNQIPSVTGIDGLGGFYKKMQGPAQADTNWLRATALRSSPEAPRALASSRPLEKNELRSTTPRDSEQSPTEGNSVGSKDQQESQKRFNRHQCRQWTVRYQELLAYRAQEGHWYVKLEHFTRSKEKIPCKRLQGKLHLMCFSKLLLSRDFCSSSVTSLICTTKIEGWQCENLFDCRSL